MNEVQVPEKNIYIDKQSGKDFLMGTFLSDIVLALLSYVAENERKNIKSRQREGIAAAKKRGVHELCNLPVTSFYRKATK